jgi:putative membrane protein
MPKGAAWDKAYMDHEVAAHQAVQALLMTAQNAAQDTTLKALIIKAQPTIDAHLKKAQDIDAKMGGGGAMPTMSESAGKMSHGKKK